MLPPVLGQSTEPVLEQVNGNCLSAGGAIRLNLGGIGESGKEQRLPGFLVVDLQDNPLVDIRCDISKLTMIKTGSVDEIYASNCLEHFRHLDTVDVLKEWRRVLKKGASCWISVPSMEANFRLYQTHGMTRWLENIMWGDQIHAHAYHYVCFDFASLARRCAEAGFSDVQKLVQMPFGLMDASSHRDNMEHKLISLNVRAIA